MQQIYVLRHANYAPPDKLTDAGEAACLKLSGTIGSFAATYTSPTNRAQRTAELVSQQRLIVDARAGTPLLPPEQRERIRQLQQDDPLGIVGVLWSDATLMALARDAGKRLISLLQQIFTELGESEQALVITHDGTMVAAEQILRHNVFEHADHTYRELEGYIVDENLRLQKFNPDHRL